jgi:hypothetical protein
MVDVMDSRIEAFAPFKSHSMTARRTEGRDTSVSSRRTDKKKPARQHRDKPKGNGFELRETQLQQNPDYAEIQNHRHGTAPKFVRQLLL